MMTSQAPQPASPLNRPGSSGCRVTPVDRLPPLTGCLRWHITPTGLPYTLDDCFHRPDTSALAGRFRDSLPIDASHLVGLSTFQALRAGTRVG